jgi:NAD(P)-dependent dehydrogenase (short-subunit alcohol dehydrogenase family)
LKWSAANIPSQAGKLAIVTGATSGLGFETAIGLAQAGADIIVASRDESHGRWAVGKIRPLAPASLLRFEKLDLANQTSIAEFVRRIERLDQPVDLLVNNAGVMALPERQITEDGFERQFGTNHLGHFALTGLLAPALEKAGSSRVVTVASLAHRNGKIEWDNLQSERSYVPWNAYNASKLANILFAKELDRRARKAGLPLVSVAVHPGISRTSIFENGPGTGNLKAKIVALLAPVLTQDDAMGALPTEYAATAPEVKGGEYIGPDGMGEFKGYPKVVNPRPQALDVAVAERLWQESERLTGVSFL